MWSKTGQVHWGALGSMQDYDKHIPNENTFE